jgi:hypothetical protein
LEATRCQLWLTIPSARDPRESLVDQLKSPIHLVETTVDVFEAPIDSIEAFVNPLSELIESLAGPALSHGLHAARLQSETQRIVYRVAAPIQLSRHLRATQRYPCQAAAQTSTNPQIAPTNGRVSKVKAMIEAAAIPTITTHLNTASSEIFICSLLSHARPRKPSLARMQGARCGSALQCVTRSERPRTPPGAGLQRPPYKT